MPGGVQLVVVPCRVSCNHHQSHHTHHITSQVLHLALPHLDVPRAIDLIQACPQSMRIIDMSQCEGIAEDRRREVQQAARDWERKRGLGRGALDAKCSE